jgi:hypothetical protein
VTENQKTDENSVLEKEIVRIVDSAFKERLIPLAADDIKIIVNEMMPDIDRIISKRIKYHFYELGLHIAETFREKE